MSEMMWWAQRGEYEAQMREEYEAARKAGWEADYEEWLDSLDVEPYEVEDER